MATTSGTAVFNYGRDQIIKASLRKIGAIASGETPDNNTIQDAADQLNIMVKAWNATGIHIWTEEEATLFMQPSQVSYTLGGTTTDHIAWGGYAYTTVSVVAAAGASTITVASTSGIVNGYKIGIGLNGGTIQWTTVNGAPVGSAVTLAAATTDSVSVGNPVFVYQTDISRPLRVVSGRRFNFSSNIDTPLIPLSRIDYRNLPNKTNTGTATQFFYDPRGGANNQGIMFVWPAPLSAQDGIKFTWYRPLQDFNASGNIPDLPTEWLDAIIWSLAVKLAPEYDCAPQRYQMIQEQAAQAMDLVMGWDREIESVYFGVNFDQR